MKPAHYCHCTAVRTLDVQMDLLILSFGELSETNMVRIDA